MKPARLTLPPVLALCCGFLLSGCNRGDKAMIRYLESEVNELTQELATMNADQAEQWAQSREELRKAKQGTAGEISSLTRERDELLGRVHKLERELAAATQPRAPEKPVVTDPGVDPAALGSVVIIEGDLSKGTGFLAQHGRRFYLYTAAHVFSGNRQISVTTPRGRKFTQFGMLEAAEGADLIRLEILDAVPDFSLLVADRTMEPRVGTEVVVLGNGGGAGVVSPVKGQILGISADSIEIDAGIIAGSSGGPVIGRKEGKVVGLVTHLTAKREDVWSKGTRLGDVRRFACRLDQPRKWKSLPVTAFLHEGRKIEEFDRLTRVAFALGNLDPGVNGMRLDMRISGSYTTMSVLTAARDLQVVADLIKMNTELGSRRIPSSDADLKRRFRNLITTAQSEISRGKASFIPENFTWYHRSPAEESVLWRAQAEAVLAQQLASLRQ